MVQKSNMIDRRNLRRQKILENKVYKLEGKREVVVSRNHSLTDHQVVTIAYTDYVLRIRNYRLTQAPETAKALKMTPPSVFRRWSMPQLPGRTHCKASPRLEPTNGNVTGFPLPSFARQNLKKVEGALPKSNSTQEQQLCEAAQLASVHQPSPKH